MKKERSRQKSIDDIVKDVIKDLSGKGRVSEEEIRRAWEEAAGKKAAKHTKPVLIKKSVLTINVDGSCWLYELTVKKSDQGTLRGCTFFGAWQR